MDELIDRVATAANISAEQARRAINLVLAFLKQQAPNEFTEMQQYLPEAENAVSAGETDNPQSGGLMGGLLNMIGAGGGLMKLASQLTGMGLSTAEMTNIGREIFAFARERAGDERVNQVAAAIPGLGQLL